MTRVAQLLTLALIAVAAAGARAETSNGNDFALYVSEAKTPAERKKIVDDALNRPHFFRYLQIMSMEQSEGRAVRIVAFEPASMLDIRFSVVKPNSLEMLRQDPESKVGDAIALTGTIAGVSSNTIVLGQVIVRHKDVLHPKRGKELLCEVDPNATFYSFTGGKRPVSLSAKDRDLLQFRDQVIARDGREGWAEFLERELAKRNAARKAERAAEKAAQKAAQPPAEAPAEPPQ